MLGHCSTRIDDDVGYNEQLFRRNVVVVLPYKGKSHLCSETIRLPILRESAPGRVALSVTPSGVGFLGSCLTYYLTEETLEAGSDTIDLPYGNPGLTALRLGDG
jgi:hypothetical protein